VYSCGDFCFSIIGLPIAPSRFHVTKSFATYTCLYWHASDGLDTFLCRPSLLGGLGRMYVYICPTDGPVKLLFLSLWRGWTQAQPLGISFAACCMWLEHYCMRHRMANMKSSRSFPQWYESDDQLLKHEIIVFCCPQSQALTRRAWTHG